MASDPTNGRTVKQIPSKGQAERKFSVLSFHQFSGRTLVRKPPKYEIAPGVLVEDVGSDCVVCVPDTTDVVSLSGEVADTLRQIRLGIPGNYNANTLSQLVSLGIIHSPSDISRRGVVRAGLIGVGVGIATLSLPSVAAASSAGEGPGPYSVSGVAFVLVPPPDTLARFSLEITPADIPPGTAGTVTLSGGGDPIPVTYNDGGFGGALAFRSETITGLGILSTAFSGLTHTLRFSVGGSPFAVPFTPQ